jgi:UDP-N-acetylmuramoyl-tripeptide--D-alanyl-D-alanine ligase
MPKAQKRKSRRSRFFRRLQKRLKTTLRRLGRRWRARLHGATQLWRYSWAQLRRIWLTDTTFVAITGSCGKTTTTKLAAAILATRGPCYRQGRGNILECSVKALLSVPASSKFCIQEVSAFPRGTIGKHIRVLRPHMAIVTTIGADHSKSFLTLEATAKEKGQLVESLPKRGIAILNADDPHVLAMATRTRAKVLTFGLCADANVRAMEVSSLWPDHLTLTVVHGDEKVRIRTQLVGEHWTTSVLAAIACGVACGIELETCATVFKNVKPAFGRYSIHARRAGPTYVLDTRKAPLWTIASGITFVARAKAPRKTIVFGTIMHYSGGSRATYREVAQQALAVADRVVFVGANAGYVDRLLRQAELRERLFAFESSYQASEFLAKETVSEELIYIKASIMDHLERIMLSQIKRVLCWRERCGRTIECWRCRNYSTPHAPPFRLPGKQYSVQPAQN